MKSFDTQLGKSTSAYKTIEKFAALTPYISASKGHVSISFAEQAHGIHYTKVLVGNEELCASMAITDMGDEKAITILVSVRNTYTGKENHIFEVMLYI